MLRVNLSNWRTKNLSNLGFTLIRIWIGISMVKYSYPVVLNNGFIEFGDWLATLGIPFPHFMAYLAKGGEFVGGVLLTIGFLARIGSFLILVNMLVAVLVVSKGMIFTGGELAFGYLLMALMIFLAGPDKWSLDQILIQKKIT